MEIKYEIIPSDITYYSKEAAKGTGSYIVQTIIFGSIALLFMGADVIVAIWAVAKNDGSITVQSFNFLPRTLIAIALIGIIYIVLITYSKHAAQKVMNNANGKNGLFCKHTIRLEENGFTETTEVNKNFLSWEGVEKITGTPSYLTIHIRLGAGYFIPKRAFSSIEEQRAFVATVQKYLSPTSTTDMVAIRADY